MSHTQWIRIGIGVGTYINVQDRLRVEHRNEDEFPVCFAGTLCTSKRLSLSNINGRLSIICSCAILTWLPVISKNTLETTHVECSQRVEPRFSSEVVCRTVVDYLHPFCSSLRLTNSNNSFSNKNNPVGRYIGRSPVHNGENLPHNDQMTKGKDGPAAF
jgi:hypothetical protein